MRMESPIEQPTDLATKKYEPTGEAAFNAKNAFVTKPLPHSPMISPSSIPNPNPSVTVTKHLETSYPSYNNYLFSIPGYSAFQPVNYSQGLPPPKTLEPTNLVKQSETTNQSTDTDFIHFPIKKPKTTDSSIKTVMPETIKDKNADVIVRTDFEDKFTTEVVTSITTTEGVESKLNITSLRQGSGAIVTIPSQIESKKKLEKFSLKTSIPISKLDMKSVNPNDNSNYNLSKIDMKSANLSDNSNYNPSKIDMTSVNPNDNSSYNLSNIDMKTAKLSDNSNYNSKIDMKSAKLSDNSNYNSKIDLKSAKLSDNSNYNSKVGIKSVNTNDNSSYNLSKIDMKSTNLSDNSNYNPSKIDMKSTNLSDNSNHNPSKIDMKTANLSDNSNYNSKIGMKSVNANDNSGYNLSKIDMKSANLKDNSNYSHVPMKPIPFKPTFHKLKTDREGSRVEIQSNVVIKSANNEMENKHDLIKSKNHHVSNQNQSTAEHGQSNNINTLISAAEVVNKNEPAFWRTDPAKDIQNDAKDLSKANSNTKQLINPKNHDTKLNFVKKPPDEAKPETKNKLVFIQNKANNNQKMLLALTQQQNNSQSQALPQKTTDSKNLQAPSRLSNVNKNRKEELIKENGSSKVVSLKRLHHEDCDENDFENLITENQIYGNKIVVKERSQGTLQEQDIKPKAKQADVKNIVLQPNFLYVSNVQFPTNIMMIKNTNTINQNITEQLKINDINRIDNKANNGNVINTNDTKQMYTKPTSNIVSKETHVLKSNNSVLQTLTGKPNTQDLIFQTNQVIMNPQIIYQVPMIFESDNQMFGSTIVNQSYSKFMTQKKEIVKEQQTKQQLPKVGIPNLNPKPKPKDEISTLDNYEKRKKMRRLSQPNNRNNTTKTDPKKIDKQVDFKNIITADNMKDEMCKEFAKTKIISEDKITDSESDYEQDELQDYANVIKEYSPKNIVKPASENKKLFLSLLKLGTQDYLKEKSLDKCERIIQRDAVAKAYIAAGRLDKLPITEKINKNKVKPNSPPKPKIPETQEIETDNSVIHLYRKQMFLAKLQLDKAERRYKEDYEKAWQEIEKERLRRNGITITIKEDSKKTKAKPNVINPNDQLKLLSDIKDAVIENNNLIKRRLEVEKAVKSSESDNICAIAEKSVSELSRLSKMADKSVQILIGKDTKKQDLTPCFDSECILIPDSPTEQPKHSQFPLIIPNISKLIRQREEQENSDLTGTPVEDPSESTPYKLNYRAYNHIEIVPNDKYIDKERQEVMVWPGIDTIKTSYKVLDSAREKEIQDLKRRNKELQASWAAANRTSTKESELYFILQTMRQNVLKEEEYWRLALVRLIGVVNAVKNYE